MEGAEVASLVADARAGDPAAWGRLVDQYSGLVWSVIRGVGLFGAEAGDVSQTVWLRFVEHLDRIREPERAGSWLATTARNEAIRVARRAGRTVLTDDVPEDTVAASVRPGPEHGLLQGEQKAVVLDALEALSPTCRMLLRLLFADPPTPYDEVCELLDMRKGSIGPTRGRCLDHLKAELAARGITA